MGEFNPAKASDKPSLKCQYLGLNRKVGWHKWTFNMDAATRPDDPGRRQGRERRHAQVAVRLGQDGSPGNLDDRFHRRRDSEDGAQTLWINGLTVAQGSGDGGQADAASAPAAVPAGEGSGAPEGPAVKYLDAVANTHPRLLFNAERLAQIKAFYNSPEGKTYREQMEGYVAGCTVPADRKTSPAWGQEYGLFKMPMVALHYVLTKDPASFEKSVAYLKWLAGTADWTEGGEPAVADTPEAYAKVMETLKHLGPVRRTEQRYDRFVHDGRRGAHLGLAV